MGRYLVLANQTLGGDRLLEELRDRCADDDGAVVHVIVPATPVHRYEFHTEGEAVAVAEERLAAALERFGELDATVTGEVGDGHPLYAVRDALRGGGYDEVILSTYPPGLSRWLNLDLISRVQREVELPVTHIVTARDEIGE